MSSINNCRNDFPIFQHHPNLVYLDSAATSLKPQAVIDAERNYYERIGATVHRGVYTLSVQATDAYEGARAKVQAFINARSAKEIIFVRGATEGINLVAATFGQQLQNGDVLLLSEMEHHADIVPWQALVQSLGVELRWIPVTAAGDLDLTNINELLQGVKLVAVTQMSNVLGTVNDVRWLAQQAHAAGAKILVDGAQSVAHMPVDVQDLDCDFLVLSGHKMLGPTGIGVLYAKQELLERLEPYQRGGDMILEVTKTSAKWNELPYKFEAGTPNIAGAIGLGAAVEYLAALGMENIWKHEQELAAYGLQELRKIPGLKVLGAASTSPHLSYDRRGTEQGEAGKYRGGTRGAIFALDLPGVHPHDVGSILDEQGIAVRAGHHCAMVLHNRFGLPATTRASGYVYTSRADIDALVLALKKAQEVLS